MKKRSRWRVIRNSWQLYLLFLPVLVYYIVFHYAPMSGIILAFKKYNYGGGIFGSEWVGLENFRRIFSDWEFLRSIRNTFVLNLGGLCLSMPAAVLLAVVLSEVRLNKSKKIMQTAITFPHFISWVVLAGIFMNMFSSIGLISQLAKLVGIEEVTILRNPSAYRWFIWLSDIWKEVGWSCIIYLAAIAGIDPGLYEAAEVDGATRLQRIRHIMLPGIKSTFCIVLIMDMGAILTSGRFDQIFNTYNALVYETADTIDTFVFRETFMQGGMNFGVSTAIGLVKSVVGLIMLLVTNKIVEVQGEQGLL